MFAKSSISKSKKLAQICHKTSSSNPAYITGHGEATRSQEIFSRAKVGKFVQSEPQHENSFSSDDFLQSFLKRTIPKDIMDRIEPDLTRFGERCATDIYALGQECEVNPPYLRQTTAWGKRVDQIVTCQAWKAQKDISAEEGLIAIPYERAEGEYSRLYQLSKLYMYSPASGLFSCPLAMTDGAAKTIESQKLNLPEAFSNLTSRDPAKFWTSGQWMTEKMGGSDVGRGTETVAVHQGGNHYKLYGYKWFSSATDSDMTLTLARVADTMGQVVEGSQGVSMFFLKTRKDDGSLNNIEVVKMKNKLGTRQLPTAELLLDGVDAELVSQPGRGIASISSMLTITRLHNTTSSVGAMRKIVSLARDYATRRKAFGQNIANQPLHIQTLSRMEVETRGCTILLLDLARQLGLHDCGVAGDVDSLLLRLMTPVAKFYTAKSAVATVSEGLECFGGQGYIEDTGLPGLLRDVQVLPIWEGTSSVMSLDVVRAIHKTRGEAMTAFHSRVHGILTQASNYPTMAKTSSVISKSLANIINTMQSSPDSVEAMARDFCLSLAHTYIAALLLEHAMYSGSPMDQMVVEKWCQRELCPVSRFGMSRYSVEEGVKEKQLVYQMYSKDATFPPEFIR